MKHLKIVLSVLLSLCCPVRSHAQQESVESFVQVTFDNEQGITVGQTDPLDYLPNPGDIQLLLNSQEDIGEMSAESATVTLVTVTSSGVVLASTELFFIARTEW